MAGVTTIGMRKFSEEDASPWALRLIEVTRLQEHPTAHPYATRKGIRS